MTRMLSLSLCVVALSFFFLGYSLLVTTNEVSKTRQQIPELLEQIERLEKNIRIESWLELSKHLDQQVPKILKEVAEVRKTVSTVHQSLPAVLNEAQLLRETTIPQLLAEVKAVRTQTIPPILAEANAIRLQTLPPVLAEVKIAQAETIPLLLNESATIRKQAPALMTRVESLVNDIEAVSANASSGAVKGIVTSPLKILEDSGAFIMQSAESLVEDKSN